MSESRMSERSETESERDLDGIDVVGYNFHNTLRLHLNKVSKYLQIMHIPTIVARR